MAKHKWHKEICAWADGAEIEYVANNVGVEQIWITATTPNWWNEDYEFRIKPQPKEPQYLYVFADLANWEATRTSVLNRKKDYETYIGKIKLEEIE